MVNKNLDSVLNPKFIGQDVIEQLQTARPNLKSRLTHVYNSVAKMVRPPFKVNVHYLSDNGGYPDTAKIEIRKRLSDINAILSPLSGQEAPVTEYHDIPSQDWRAGAFDIAQITEDTVRGPGNVVFLNCAPRRKERGNKVDNEGEGVYIGMHRNGTILSAVSEDSFSLFRDQIESGELEVFRAGVQIKGSQFRSRDFFPWLSQIIAFNAQKNAAGWKANMPPEDRRKFLEKLSFVQTDQKLTAEDVTDFSKEPSVLRADCHGNLKLSVRKSDVVEMNVPFNEPLIIKIGGEEKTAVLKEGMFDPNDHSNIGLAFGSSGANDPFLELAILGESLRESWDISDQQLKEGVTFEIVGPAHSVVELQPEAPKTAAPVLGAGSGTS